MKIKVVVHEAEEGGYWAEVPAIPGCATQGETMDELMANLHDGMAGSFFGSPAVTISSGRAEASFDSPCPFMETGR